MDLFEKEPPEKLMVVRGKLSQRSRNLLAHFEHRRALTPLIWGHVNPYGLFRLDMNARLVIEKTETAGQ